MKTLKQIFTIVGLIIACFELSGCVVYSPDPAGYPYGLVYPPQVNCNYAYNCCPGCSNGYYGTYGVWHSCSQYTCY